VLERRLERVDERRRRAAAVACRTVTFRRWMSLLGDLHFWIPLVVLAAGVALLRWLA
jgi:hypothetical protein